MVLRSRSNKAQFTETEKAILTTILYSDIFHSPLTKDELWRFLISGTKINYSAFHRALQQLQPQYIVFQHGYYYLPGKDAQLQTKEKNVIEAEKKVRIAQKAAKQLSCIPGILFIGISGGLAVANAAKDDDIDFFIIVKKNTLFLSRFWILLYLSFLGLRRKRGMKHAKNMICVNLLLDTSALYWPEAQQNIYTAREIAQIIPVYETEGAYRDFLHTNKWVEHFLPNVFQTPSLMDLRNNLWTKKSRILQIISRFYVLEKLLRVMQITYINRHKTIETVTNHQLAFHPTDYKTKTLTLLKLKMRHLGLLTI